MKNWTGERLETFIYSRDAVDHLHRYAIASEYTKGKTVLDIASGEGYGSYLLSKNALYVHGVDIDDVTVEHAKAKYKNNNLDFLTGSAISIPIASNSIDVVVSFETIEHHDHHDEMIAEIRRVLKSDGIIIISTPDKLHYSDKRNFNNKFHIKELYKDEFVNLIKGSFNQMQLLTQKYCNGNSIIEDEAKQDQIKYFSGDYTSIEYTTISALYLVAIASDVLFEQQNTTVFDGTILNNIIKKNAVINSNTFKVGHYILLPLKWLKKKFR